MHHRFLSLFCALALALVAGPARADHDEEYEALRTVTVTLPQAIEIAQRKYPGYVVEAKLEEENGMFYYQVELVWSEGQAEVYVHPANGLVIGSESETGMAIRIQRRWEARLAALNVGDVSVFQAIDIARREAEGHVREVDLKKRRGVYFYRVTLCDEQNEHEIDVNLNDGSVIRHDVGS